MPNDTLKQVQLGSNVLDIEPANSATAALVSNTTAAGGIAYIEVASFDTSTGTLNLVTKYLHI